MKRGIDFEKLLLDLTRCGINSRMIARKLNISRSGVEGWKRGQEPHHSSGERLLDYWCEITAKPADQAPRR